ncbi:MAG: inorganic phosphate transporter [Archaeoglobaceae archaeon]
MLELVSLLAFLLIAFSIGSNDTSNAFGVCIGCKIISLRKATLILLALVLLGIFLQGERIMKTVGKDLVELSVEISAIAMLIAAVIIVSSNFRGLPVSTHQVIIGSLMGTAVAFGAQVSFKTFLGILASWIISPLISGIFAVTIFLFLENLLKKFSLIEADRILKIFIFCSATLIAYNTGANELATAMAPVIHAKAFEPLGSAILGAFLLWLGAFLLSTRVIETVCKGITVLDPKSGLSAHLGAGIAVLGFTSIGMPVSTTYAMIGGIASVGFLKGIRAVRVETLKKIAVNWIFAITFSFAIGFLVAKAILFIS